LVWGVPGNPGVSRSTHPKENTMTVQPLFLIGSRDGATAPALSGRQLASQRIASTTRCEIQVVVGLLKNGVVAPSDTAMLSAPLF
jgi:hypothetical protein